MQETLGKRIVQNRKRMGLTQDQLAEKLGVTAQAVSKWENDQSCPDITMLPRLAEIFGTSTDELLGRQTPPPLCEAELVTEEDAPDGVRAQVGGLEFHWDSGRTHALGFAVLVLAVGILTLLSNIFSWGASFWDILWPTAILTFGLFSKEFSFFRLGCIAVGGYFLLSNLHVIHFKPGGGIIFPALVILFGLSLLADALKKPRKGRFHVTKKGDGKKVENDYRVEGEGFTYHASFGETAQTVALPRLSRGEVHVSFGEYTVDLRDVEAVSQSCQLEAHCSFGELRLLIPRRYRVQAANSTAFAEISVSGEPYSVTEGTIQIEANASFGEISIEYI